MSYENTDRIGDNIKMQEKLWKCKARRRNLGEDSTLEMKKRESTYLFLLLVKVVNNDTNEEIQVKKDPKIMKMTKYIYM